MDKQKRYLPSISSSLRQIGHSIEVARRRRRLPVALLAERARISRITLMKIQRGDPGVAFGSYLSVLFALGLLKQVTSALEQRNDETGLELELENLPKRIRTKKWKEN